jgi:hypothetical protein
MLEVEPTDNRAPQHSAFRVVEPRVVPVRMPSTANDATERNECPPFLPSHRAQKAIDDELCLRMLVFVNGVEMVHYGEHTGAKPGRGVKRDRN